MYLSQHRLLITFIADFAPHMKIAIYKVAADACKQSWHANWLEYSGVAYPACDSDSPCILFKVLFEASAQIYAWHALQICLVKSAA